jgi:hypothetical protein
MTFSAIVLQFNVYNDLQPIKFNIVLYRMSNIKNQPHLYFSDI